MDQNVIYSSFIAGSIQTILGHPFDTVKTRIQLYNTSYKNTISHLFRQEGITSFYKGSFFPFISGCCQNCFIFSLEDYFQNYFQNHYITGFVAGSISSIIT